MEIRESYNLFNGQMNLLFDFNFMNEKFVSLTFFLDRHLMEPLLLLMVTIRQLGCLRSVHLLLRRELEKTSPTCTEIPRVSGDVL